MVTIDIWPSFYYFNAFSTIQLPGFLNHYCSDIIKASIEGDAESFSEKCREWIFIAVNVCTDRFLQETTVAKRVWGWVLSLVNFKASTDETKVDSLYEIYVSRPNNLTLVECSNLIRNLCNSLMAKNYTPVDDYRKSLIEPAVKDSMWICDFLLYLNVIIMLSFVVAQWIVQFDAKDSHQRPESQEKSTQAEDRSIVVNSNLQEIRSILLTEVGESSTDETLKVLDGTLLVKEETKIDSEPKTESGHQSTPRGEASIGQTEMFSSNDFFETTFETPPSTIESPTVTSTPNSASASVKKIVKNYVNINKNNLKLISAKRSQSSLSSLSNLTKPKSRASSSSIPVRVTSRKSIHEKWFIIHFIQIRNRIWFIFITFSNNQLTT